MHPRYLEHVRRFVENEGGPLLALSTCDEILDNLKDLPEDDPVREEWQTRRDAVHLLTMAEG